MDRCRGNYIKKVFRDLKHTQREKGALTSEKLYNNRKITDLCFARDGRTRIVGVTTGHTQVTAVRPLLVARLSTHLPLGLTGTLERNRNSYCCDWFLLLVLLSHWGGWGDLRYGRLWYICVVHKVTRYYRVNHMICCLGDKRCFSFSVTRENMEYCIIWNWRIHKW